MQDSLRTLAHSKIYSIDQSHKNFNMDDWCLNTFSDFDDPSTVSYFCLQKDEIMMFEDDYREELKEAYEEALMDIERYGQWLGYKI